MTSVTLAFLAGGGGRGCTKVTVVGTTSIAAAVQLDLTIRVMIIHLKTNASNELPSIA